MKEAAVIDGAKLATDNRAVGRTTNAEGRLEISSPYIHVHGIETVLSSYQASLDQFLASEEYKTVPDANKPTSLDAKIKEIRSKLGFADASGGWSVAMELLLYVAHGMDHLSGADDLDERSRAGMRARELRWLREFRGNIV